MPEDRGITRDEKLALAIKLSGQIDLSRAPTNDVYDMLMILAHLLFSGRNIKLTVQEFICP
jgi:hypothetical protein